MKHLRKGFTLVELLIVIAILGTLSAAMSVSTNGATARAKASAIAANVDAAKSAAILYYANHAEDANLLTTTAETVLGDYIKTWTDFKRTGDSITYSVDGAGPSSWALTVNFASDADKDAIKTALQKIKGYKQYLPSTENATATDIMGSDVYTFKVMLSTGEILPVG